MGVALWVTAGIAAWIVTRILPTGRSRKWLADAAIALIVAAAAGLIATALDFGGWREVDWRAGMFAFLLALAATGATRVVRAA